MGRITWPSCASINIMPYCPLLSNVWGLNLEMHHIHTGYASWSNPNLLFTQKVEQQMGDLTVGVLILVHLYVHIVSSRIPHLWQGHRNRSARSGNCRTNVS